VSFFVYLIAFGGNTGDRVLNARGALSYLEQHGRIGRQSQWKMTEPLRSEEHDTTDHDVYLNFVFEFESALAPDELYARICRIEDHFGHDREQRWRPRAVDLDLLFCSMPEKTGLRFEPRLAFKYSSPDGRLSLPHPQIWRRHFLLEMMESDLGINLNSLSKITSEHSEDFTEHKKGSQNV
jgi:2-amino-4-hydroxy-6-hydroxymethyldihydropteridine diphosphokinase